MKKMQVNLFKKIELYITSHWWEIRTLNSNFTIEEIEAAIDYFMCKKSPGANNIPAEFIKSRKTETANDLIDVFNSIIKKRDFPDGWTEGIRYAVHKGRPKISVNDLRGITILPFMGKIFEIIVYKRSSFLNEDLHEYNNWNVGYMANVRAADNMCILNGIIQKPRPIGTAFDLVNRNILFYKLLWSG